MPKLKILTAEEVKVFDKPPHFTKKQRQKYFHLNEKLISLVKKLRSSTNKVCLILQWGYFRACGRFFLVSDFRDTDIRYISQLLGLEYSDVNLVDYHAKRKTCRSHQHIILNAMNFQPLSGHSKSWFQSQIENLVTKQIQPREIIFHLASQCHQQKIEIPSYHYFSERITQCYNQVEANLLKIIDDHISLEQKQRLNELLNSQDGLPLISQWKIQSQKLQVKQIQADIKLFSKVKECFYLLSPLIERLNLNPNSHEYYATWIKKAKISQLKQIPNKLKLYLYLTAFIQHQFYARQDALMDVFLKSVQAMQNRAKKKRLANEESQRKKKNTLIKQLIDEQDRLEALITNIASIIHETSLTDQNKIDEIKTLLQQHQTIRDKIKQQGSPDNKKKLKQLLNDESYYKLLEEISVALQRRVSNIAKVLDFHETTSEKTIIAAIQHYRNTDGNITKNAPIDFLDNKQQKLCFDNNKMRISLYKSQLFIHMAESIKSGYLNLKVSVRSRTTIQIQQNCLN